MDKIKQKKSYSVSLQSEITSLTQGVSSNSEMEFNLKYCKFTKNYKDKKCSIHHREFKKHKCCIPGPAGENGENGGNGQNGQNGMNGEQGTKGDTGGNKELKVTLVNKELRETQVNKVLKEIQVNKT